MLRVLLSLVVLFSFTAFAGEGKKENHQAPSWELYDESNHLVKSEQFAGKPLMIHFWATWCPYCKKLQPGLQRLQEKYADDDLQLIAISFWEDDGATPQAVLAKRGLDIKTLVNGDKVAKELFKVKGTPTTFFIDAKGTIIAKTRVSDPGDPRLEKVVRMIVGKD